VKIFKNSLSWDTPIAVSFMSFKNPARVGKTKSKSVSLLWSLLNKLIKFDTNLL
jgi:hypothetical protein